MSTEAPTPPRAYKGFSVRMGVYAVRHLPSGRVLLGRSAHLQGSLNRHRFELDLGKHPVQALQDDWRRDGPAAFAFEVLDALEPDPAKGPSHDYGKDLEALEALWRQQLGLPERHAYAAPAEGGDARG